MVEYLLTVFVIFVVVYALIKGCNINVNISVKQEFSSEDRQLLEDLFNKDGDPKKEYDQKEIFDNVVETINNIMLDNEEESNG